MATIPAEGEKLDVEQEKMLAEQVILVDRSDKKVGVASKKESHLITNIKEKNLLHRAFSVFLFNADGKLMLQQRSSEKITFPDVWTNTCCSHPLSRVGEVETQDDLSEKIEGVKTAAIRKLEQELGIPQSGKGSIPRESFKFLTRIYYRSIADDPKWGEHEVDYILFAKQDTDPKINPNEVKDIAYVTPQELKDRLSNRDTSGETFSPWSQLIIERFLYSWWDNLDNIVSDNYDIDSDIHDLGDKAI